MPELDGLARVIAALGSDSFAPTLFDWIRGTIPAENLSVLAYRGEAAPDVLFSSVQDSDLNRHLNALYASGLYRLDPFYALHEQGAAKGAYALRDIAPDQFSRNAYFLQFYRQSGMVDELAFVAHPAPLVSIHVCLSRQVRPFSGRDIRRADPLAPVIVALMEQHWKGEHVGANTGGRHDALSAEIQSLLRQGESIALTRRQAEVAALILQGHSTASIALALEVSPQTVKVFRKQLYRRCNISSQSELFSLLMPRLGRLLSAV